MHDAHRFHAVLHTIAAGAEGLRRGALARRFRARALRLAPAALTALLEELVRARILCREPDGRAERYRAGPEIRAFLAGMRLPAGSGVRYRAEHVASLVRFLDGVSRAIGPDPGVSATAAPSRTTEPLQARYPNSYDAMQRR